MKTPQGNFNKSTEVNGIYIKKIKNLFSRNVIFKRQAAREYFLNDGEHYI